MKHVVKTIIEQTHLSEQQAWWLIEFVTGKPIIQLRFIHTSLSPEEQAQLDTYLYQIHVEHKPLAYILGTMPFLNLELCIMPPILIPRPETEYWINSIIEKLQHHKEQQLNILDIGTGSGCIALSLAQAFPYAHVYAVDLSLAALDLAKKNAQIHHLTNITFLQSDVYENISHKLQFDLILSNPPYIDPNIELDKNVIDWEDHQALFAANKGLAIIEKIIAQAKTYLKNNALPFQLSLEIDTTQGIQVANLLQQAGFNKISIQKDQFNRDRTVYAK